MENKKKEESIKRILKAARKNQEFRQALIEEMEKVQRENLKT
jgi:transposase|tara:strand:+ start:532 stop:657 length:126 start_codon:yes stop_codon:yes gene_type:complete